MLDLVRNGALFKRAFEIGCCEGLFTERLAARSESLVAVDISPIALERTRTRCGDQGHVCVTLWNLRSDPLPSAVDLIIVSGVLEMVYNPLTLYMIRAKLVDGLCRGGLLVNRSKQREHGGRACWRKCLIRAPG